MQMNVDSDNEDCSEQPSLNSVEQVDKDTIRCFSSLLQTLQPKGPWFRFDNIYNCYFTPTDSSVPEEEEEENDDAI